MLTVMEIRLEQPYVPEDDGRAIARLHRDVDWPAVPRVGDIVMLDAGAVGHEVVKVYWDAGGRALIHLRGDPTVGPHFTETEVAGLLGAGWVRAPQD
jgi:hypothetical protein